MNTHTTRLAARALPLLAAALFVASLASDAAAQKRPSSVDTSAVQVSRRTVKPISHGSGKPVAVASKFGLIIFGPIIPDAKVLIDDKPAKSVEVDKAGNRVLVDDVPPGTRKITYDHPDYVLITKSVPVRAGSQSYFFLTPKLAATTLTVTTEPDTAVYIDSVPRGTTPANGVLKLDDVKLGSHEIKLVKDAYQEYKATSLFEYEKPVSLSARLVPMPSSAEFNEFFDININRWTKPASGWTLVGGRLALANAPDLGYPTGVNYRDCLMAFHLKLKNGVGAAWAVRVKDPKNYYLFLLSGPQGPFPGYFNTYVVRDGQFDLSNPNNSVPVIANIKAGGEYEIELLAKGDVLTHTITPSDTGKAEPLAVFKDPANTYTYGGIGFRTVGNEQFSVDDLFVQPK